jgi:hypothetical protein
MAFGLNPLNFNTPRRTANNCFLARSVISVECGVKVIVTPETGCLAVPEYSSQS